MVERPAAGDAVRDGNRMDTGRLSRLHAVRGVLEGYRLRRAHLQAVQLHDPGTWSEPRDSVSTISPSKSKIRARSILHGSWRELANGWDGAGAGARDPIYERWRTGDSTGRLTERAADTGRRRA